MHQPRCETRTPVVLPARLRAGGPESAVMLLDVSSRGMLAACGAPPPRGAFVELLAEGRSFVGQVQWSAAGRFGLVLRDRLDVAGLLRGDAAPLAERAAAPAVAAPSLRREFTTMTIVAVAAALAALQLLGWLGR